MKKAARDYLTGALSGTTEPGHLGQKFTRQGEVLTCLGNTWIYHIDVDTPAHDALCAAQSMLRSGPFAASFAFLPTDSFHMTLFEGIIETGRSEPGWPQGIARTADLSEVTQTLLAATRSIALPQRVKVRPTGILGGFSVVIDGGSDERRFRDARRALRDATGIHRSDFDDYDFHVTLAYPLRWFTPQEADSLIDLADRAAELLVPIALPEVTFCTFADMHVFTPIRAY